MDLMNRQPVIMTRPKMQGRTVKPHQYTNVRWEAGNVLKEQVVA